MNLCIYLIKRGPKSKSHKAPFHPVILCTRKHTAKWEAGATSDKCWVWTHDYGFEHSGWLLERWNGLDVDYGPVVNPIELPDGTKAAFFHDKGKSPWILIKGAVWWSNHKIPTWIQDRGCLFVKDSFSIECIERDDGTCGLPMYKQEKLEEQRDKKVISYKEVHKI